MRECIRAKRLIEDRSGACLYRHVFKMRHFGSWSAKHEAGYGNDGDRCINLPNGFGCFQAIHAGHEQVDHDEVKRPGLDRIDARFSAFNRNRFEAFGIEQYLRRTPYRFIVVNQQNAMHSSISELSRESESAREWSGENDGVLNSLQKFLGPKWLWQTNDVG